MLEKKDTWRPRATLPIPLTRLRSAHAPVRIPRAPAVPRGLRTGEWALDDSIETALHDQAGRTDE